MGIAASGRRRALAPPSNLLHLRTVLESNEFVKVGLVGAGYVSTYHARALRSLPFVEIVGIADPDEDRA